MIKYTKQAEAAIEIAKKKAKQLDVTYIGTEHILVGLLGVGSGIASALLGKYGVNIENVVNIVDTIVKKEGGIALELAGSMTPKAEQVLKLAQAKSTVAGTASTGTEHILIALLETKGTVAYRILKSLNVDFDKMISELNALSNGIGKQINMSSDEAKEGAGFKHANLLNDMMGFNVSSADDTPTLNEYGRDLTLEARNNRLDPVIGRSYEMERIIQILSRRTKNNPCLIGEPGVGKTAIVEGLAIAISKGDVPDCLLGKRIVMLDLTSTVAGSKYRGEFEERLKNIINEVTNSKDVLLFIDEIHTLIGAGSAEGSLDASNILKPSLARGEVQVIGATTIGEYRKRIEKDPALERRFQPVEVDEPTEEETVLLLKGIRKQYEEFHKVNITDDAIEAAVSLSARYINDRFLPDKAIDVIDEASAKVKLKPITMPKA
ncbi:MAG TPA: ATP-dependent Clp protease ATP-binding subunit ClpC, partial [Eubacterium sp.]|nr:ATP-dependent Clp protease ATP-binding subunit ClpC [Eubacterium sp.]